MKLQGITDRGLKRIAQSMDIGEDESIGGKPVPLSVDMSPSSGSGYLDPPITLEDGWDWEKVFGRPSATPEEIIAFLEESQDINILEDVELDGPLSLSYLQEIVDNSSVETQSNTTYNWGWWGPTVGFTVAGEGAVEPYGSAVLFLSAGMSAKGPEYAFILDSYAEEAPWYDLRLNVVIETDKGLIRLDSEDDEAFRFYVYQDETGTWPEGESIDYNELMEKLDWQSSDLHDIW